MLLAAPEALTAWHKACELGQNKTEEDAAKHMRWALAEQAVAAQDMLTTTCIPQP